jgi:hypothetical protein
MTDTELVLDPALAFGELEARLSALGFTRDSSVSAVTLPAIPDEPELAAWTRGGERLTYTFNPVVSLRAIAPVGISDRTRARLITGLPVLDLPSIGQLLTETEPRRILLGLYAARAAGAGELALVVASLQAHPDRTISRAAASTLEAVRSARGSTPREQTLAVMQVLCRRAIPVLAALLGPEGAARVEAMRPRPEDYARVFRADVVDRVRAAYENLWRTPPQLDRLVSGDVTLRVDAAPAGMLSDENELSRRFPGGYRAAAPYLLADRVWFVWRYLHGGAEAGMRYDGVVLLDDRWAWFPKPYVVLGELVQSTAS